MHLTAKQWKKVRLTFYILVAAVLALLSILFKIDPAVAAASLGIVSAFLGFVTAVLAAFNVFGKNVDPDDGDEG